VVKYDASYQPPVRRITRKFNASLSAYHDLMTKRGYVLVGCNLAGIHAFFVRADLARDRFATPLDAENHFEPPRLHLVPRPEGCVGPTTYGSQGV
jgi:hypothetical protein